MFHLIHGHLRKFGDRTFIDTSVFGIEVMYTGEQNEGTYFLSCLFDQGHQTWRYYGFDSIEQRKRFESILKIQGVGGKNGYQIAMLPPIELHQAVEQFDSSYFQKLPGIGPKTAKRLLVELKQTLSDDDFQKINLDEKLSNDITQALKSLGYPVAKIKKLLPDVPYQFNEENTPEIMKWLINHL